MKRILYILFTVVMAVACTKDILPGGSNVREGDPVKLTFSVLTPDPASVPTKALGDITDDQRLALNLWLFVYDSEGIFVQAAQATPKSNSGDETLFDVTLDATSARCIIHFIAYDGDAGSGVGEIINNIRNQFGTESSQIARQLITSDGQAAYWQRQEVNGITEDTKFKRVPLVRNFAKVSVTSSASDFEYEGFTVVNAPDRGFVAPYTNGTFVDYTSGESQKDFAAISVAYGGQTPSGVVYTNPASSATVSSKNPYYLYETPNSGALKGNTFLIVKGKYNNASTSTYYKVDLVHVDEATSTNHFYDVLRNFEYKVSITAVNAAGFGDVETAAANAAGNNLSASTSTASLTQISDGVQRMQVSDIYYCYTEGGAKAELKYKYEYSTDNGASWTKNNGLVSLSNSNATLFSVAPAIATSDEDSGDYAGWRTVTMTLNNPGAEALSSVIHLFADSQKISAADLSGTINGELLSRDVTVVLRKLYDMKVNCPTYVKGVENTSFSCNLLIPTSINDALFPLDFQLEPASKTISPDASAAHRMPVRVGPSIVTDSEETSFQFVRNLSKEEYATLGTKTVNGSTYKVVPCVFQTNVAESATTIYANNKYFGTQSGTFSNIPIAFVEESVLTITGTEYYGKNREVPISFEVTEDAVGRQFTLVITEDGESTTETITPTTAGTQTYTYLTKTFGENTVSATVTAHYQRENEMLSASSTVARNYFVIKAGSFTVPNMTFVDHASIYIGGYRCGWIGNTYGLDTSENVISSTGLLQDYRVDVSYASAPQGVTDPLTITPTTEVRFIIDQTAHKNDYIITTAGALDDAANGVGEALVLQLIDEASGEPVN